MRMFLATFGFLLVSFPTHSAVVLQNDRWTVKLEPETLAIEVQCKEGTPLTISSGIEPNTVRGLTTRPYKAVWQWENSGYTVSADLEGSDLSLSISAKNPGTLTVLKQPAAAWGKGLIFPLAEGSYIPKDDKVWEKFLLERLAEFNTSQDISLPLWGLDRETFSLSWILKNPFNNTARFTRGVDGLDLSLEHEFTALEFNKPMTMMLHLGAADPLAGSKRYREWLLAEGNYETLKQKIATTPEAEKLIGAPHVYLWGGGLIASKDITSWPRFLQILKGDSPLAKRLRSKFDTEAISVLKETKEKPYNYQQRVIVRAFNEGVNSLARESWQNSNPDMAVLTQRYGDLRNEVAVNFVDALDEDVTHWGGGVSMSTMQTLKDSDLKRLWIGLGEGWEGGLWHPEAIKAGVDSGFLVAPYDSYETALRQGDNPSWATAHLGEAAFQDCAIRQKDGSIKAGFQQSGRYTQPDCVRHLMQARISAILSAAPFNSWFLDAYATGMVFDSYRPAKEITQAQYARGNQANMRWVGQKLKLPIGSEDGNATTSQGVIFAHGMQTPVIGWGDSDMQKDRSSQYYLGRWYPNEKPETFFKRVPLKEPYKTIYFDPRTRLPLYQAVFHGSVITSHHWLFDNMKLTNVSSENELTQLLYNVPPLIHLSNDTLQERLPYIRRHTSFFSSLHKQLATEQLIEFRWLTPDHLVQQTTYRDGSKLAANFSGKPYNYNGIALETNSIVATLAGSKEPIVYRVSPN